MDQSFFNADIELFIDHRVDWERMLRFRRGPDVSVSEEVETYKMILRTASDVCSDIHAAGRDHWHEEVKLVDGDVKVPQHNLAVIPELPPGKEELSWSEAAAFSLVTLTAWRMLITRARLQPGDRVLIWGFGGGVSSAALMIAKSTGAYVIVTSSSDAKLNLARSLGADATLNHAQTDVVREVRQLTGKRGVDVVVENVGEATWEQSLRVLARQGKLVTCGATTGPRAVTDIRRMFWNQWTLMGSTMGNASEYHDIVKLLGQGHLRPVVDSTFPLGNAVAAFERLESGQRMGKVVVEMD